MKLLNYRIFYEIIYFNFSLFYSLFLTFFFPFDNTIVDRANYLNYAENSSLILLSYLNENILSFLFNEPIWLLINLSLSLFFEPENTLKIIIFFSSFTVSYLILKYNSKYFLILLLFLIFPNIIKNFIVHIRQGLAISFFLIGWFSVPKLRKYIFLTISPFIHASFFLILTIYFITYLLKKIKFSFDLRLITYIIIGLIISFGLSFIASILNTRQANEYEFIAANSSGLGFIFWCFVFFIYISDGKEFLRNHSFIIGIIVLYLTTYFFVEITARVFESGLLLVLLASLELKNKKKFFVHFLFIIFTILIYIQRIDKNLLGFGI